MSVVRAFLRRLSGFAGKERKDREMEEELASHLQMQIEENLQSGMTPDEARRDALLKAGGLESAKEACRDLWSLGWLETWWRDVRHAARLLRRSPGFTIVAVLSLALGIGVNTLVFSLFNGVLLKPLRVPEPDRLRVVNWTGWNVTRSYYSGSGAYTTRSGQHVDGSFSYPLYAALRDSGVGFSDLFAFSELANIPVVFRGEATTSFGMIATGNFFRGLGAGALVGRTFLPEDDRPGAAPVAVVSHSWWEGRAGRDPGLIGQTVLLNGASYTIIGVLPREFVAPVTLPATDFYVPMAAQPSIASFFPLSSPKHWWIRVMGRLRDGADERQAQSAFAVLFARMSAHDSGQKIDRPGIVLEDGSTGPLNGARREMRQILSLLMGVVGLVLLIACANLASMLLARGAARGHEMAIRVAIGAGRARLIRQLLTESALLGLAGGVLGLLLTPLGTALLSSMLASIEEAPHFDFQIDHRVLLFTLAVSLTTALIFGLLPALRAARKVPAVGLGDRAGRGAPRLRLVRVLVVAQVALSLLLLVGAGLFLRTLFGLSRVDPGFQTENLLTLRLDASKAGYRGQALVGFYERARASLAVMPGVREVSASNLALLGHGVAATGFTVPGMDTRGGFLQANILHVGESFLRTMGIPLLAGRDLSPADNEAGPKVAIVNETLTRTLLPGLNPVGTTLRMGDRDVQVVGVCRDAKYEDLGRTSPIIYLPYRQYAESTGAMFFELRTAVPPLSTAASVRRSLAALDRNVPLTSVRTQADLVDESLMPFRLMASLCGSFGLLALLLSAIGLYGVMSYSVARRTGEIGVRMALGAQSGDVLRMVLRDAVVLTGIGVGLGIPAATGATLVARSSLFGIRLLDPAVPAGAIGLLVAVAAIAAAIPALRAARIDPIQALRHE